MSEWISVEDGLPEEGQYVLCAAHIEGDNTWWFGCCQYNGFFPWVKFNNPDPVECWKLIEPPK